MTATREPRETAEAGAARRLGLVLLWLLTGAGLLAVAAGLAAGLAIAVPALAGSELGEVQRAVWLALARAVALGALAPLLAFTVLGWWALVALRPSLDASWRSLAVGVPALAAAAFPAVGAWGFSIWTPQTPWDYLGTLLLLAGGTAAALLLARRLVPALAPGALVAREGPGNPTPRG